MRKTNKGMAKILSTVMVLCMIAAMLPVTFANATETSESVTYDFNPDLTHGQNLAELQNTYELYGWEVAGGITSGYRATANSTNGHDCITIGASGSKHRPQGAWYAFKVKAPAAGVYAATLGYAKIDKDYQLKGDVYFIPGSVVDAASGIAGAMAMENVDNYKERDDVIYSNSGENIWKNTTDIENITINDNETDYYVVFRKPVEDSNITDGSYTASEYAAQYPSYITLTKTANIERKYTFTYDFNHEWAKDTSLVSKTFEDTKQSWIFADRSRFDVSAAASRENRDHMLITGSSGDARTPGMWVALKLKTPVAGEYTATLVHGQAKDSAAVGDVYWIPVNDAPNGVASVLAMDKDAEDPYKKKDSVEYGLAGANKWDAETELGTFVVKEGDVEHYIVFRIPIETEGNDPAVYQMYPASLTLTAGDSLVYMGANISLSNEITTVGDAATVSAKGYLSDGSEAEVTVGSITSSNTSVIKLVAGGIAAVGAGKATISASVTYEGETQTVTKEISVADISVEKTVTVAVDYAGDGENIVVDSTTYKLGDEVEITAEEIEGKVFRGWLRGSADNGRLVSTEETYKFKAMTNIALTAIYIDAPVGEVTEYYNWNGEFLGTVEPSGENVPSLVGYIFANIWKDGGKIGEISRKIAEFTKQDTAYAVTKEAGESFTMTSEDSKYDTEVTCEADKAVYWYRDGKLVDYGTKYSFFIWEATSISTSENGNDGAKIMLDKNKEDSWMIEYDAGQVGKDNILEVGIIFGNSGVTPTVDSCEEKMSSQRDDFTHGQFAATSDYPVARGYLIYSENGEYKVIYAD
ncbi:MAG: hypothetical protein IJO09_07260 [Oscillospiraceae bacterium]|nr:hypothetical protein [Oscillospiraceae bacterium]